MGRVDLKGLTYAETVDFFASIGERPWRADQVRSWMFEKGAASFAEMTDLSKGLRARLEKEARLTALAEAGRVVSSDGTMKFLFRLEDGHTVESVWIPEKRRATLCVSTQVGCKLGCAFCLTGSGGFVRDLSAVEIVDQLVQARRLVPGGRITNVVLMGMGEPLDNYDNVLAALKVMTEPERGLAGARRVTLSTAGITPGILKLAGDYPKIKLAISLNAPDDAVRNELMPINRKYPLAALMGALRKWPLPKGKNITFEYVLLAGVNDSADDARALHRLLGRLPATVNLIPYNPCPGLPFERPDDEAVELFWRTLKELGRDVTIRKSRGGDILAACGQLRERAGEEEPLP
ncbi:MAG: 23S rRNA (adenine(2503)-C(2))-methyltransferase RlmN [Candidatus Nitrospinota bacterium M3_3B_026]